MYNIYELQCSYGYGLTLPGLYVYLVAVFGPYP